MLRPTGLAATFAASRRYRPAQLIALAGLLFLAAYAGGLIARPSQGYLRIQSNIVYNFAPLAALGLSIIPIRKSSGRERLGWICLVAVLATWQAGDWTYSYYDLVLSSEPPFPGFADAGEIMRVSGTLRDPGGESRGLARKPALLIGNQCDRPGARENFEVLEELWRERFPQRLAVSAATGENLEALRRALFDLLGVVRVYTKQPGKKADLTAPYVLPRGATVRDVAARVHKDIAAHLKFARLWGGTRFDGQRVEREHVVDDQDVIELHA